MHSHGGRRYGEDRPVAETEAAAGAGPIAGEGIWRIEGEMGVAVMKESD